MLYCVHMDVRLPPGTDPALFDRLDAEEMARLQALGRSGKRRQLWRVAGRQANISVFDVAGRDELPAIHQE